MNHFENQLDKLIRVVNQGYGFGWKNNPDRNYQGTYINGEVFDYVILSRKCNMFFDAKETIYDKWQVRKKDEKQAVNLLKVAETGNEAFFLIHFKNERKSMKIDIQDFWKIRQQRKHIKITDCKMWDYKKLFESRGIKK